jgi:hypothetical protein
MTEIWSGTLDARLDTTQATGQQSAGYVLSGIGRAEDDGQVEPEDALNFKERIVIRDRDQVPFPHIGLWLQLVLEKDVSKCRGGVKTYIVRRLITARPALSLNRSIYARALCNGIAQCKARADRINAKAGNRSATALRDVPISGETNKYIGSLAERPTTDLSGLLTEPHRLANGVFSGVQNYFVCRGALVEYAIGQLFAALKNRPLVVRASALADCSLGQLQNLTWYVEHTDAFSMLFGSSGSSAVVTYESLPLCRPLQLARST